MNHARLVVAVLAAVLVATGEGASGQHASAPLSIAFASTLPSWPPPPDLDAWSLSSVPVSGAPPALLDRETDDGHPIASPSPDGRLLAIVRGEGGPVRLVNADGSGERVLFTPDPIAREALDLGSTFLAWAPDGKRIAIGLYTTRFCGPTSTKCAVWYVAIVDVDGRRVGTIGSARDPSWSPDGSLLAVESNNIFGLEPEATTIDIVRPTGETVRAVGRPTPRTRNAYVCLADPTWSPDARFVTFDEQSCNGEPLDRFHVVRAADGTPVSSEKGWVMDWDPRAGLFAFGNLRGFSVARTRDGTALRSWRGWFAGWGPAPRSVVYVGPRPRWPLFVSALGGDPRRLAASTTECVTLSPSRRRLYYAGGETGHPLWSVRADGSGRKRLAPRTSGDCALPSPDGELLAFWPTSRTLAVVRSGGGARRAIARFSAGSRKFLLGWADAGRRLLAKSYVAPLERPALWLGSADGTAARRVTPVGVGAASPAWSPDGTRIVFVRTPGEGEQPAGLLSLIGTDGRGLRTLVRLRGQHVSSPSWSPDGATIAYSCGDAYAICAIRADGTRQRIVIAPRFDPSIGQIYLWSPDWTPDSQWIVYAKGEPGRGASVRAVRPDGTDDRLLLETNIAGSVFQSLAVSPDGARLALAGQACQGQRCVGGLWVAGSNGHGLRFVEGTANAEAPSWSPDGRTVVFSLPVGLGFGRRGLYTVDVDGGAPRPFTRFRADAADPDWRRAP